MTRYTCRHCIRGGQCANRHNVFTACVVYSVHVAHLVNMLYNSHLVHRFFIFGLVCNAHSGSFGNMVQRHARCQLIATFGCDLDWNLTSNLNAAIVLAVVVFFKCRQNPQLHIKACICMEQECFSSYWTRRPCSLAHDGQDYFAYDCPRGQPVV